MNCSLLNQKPFLWVISSVSFCNSNWVSHKVLFFFTEGTNLSIYIHQGCLHFRCIACLGFNQLANSFHALEINYKNKIKRNMLITIAPELFPWVGGSTCLARETAAFVSYLSLESEDGGGGPWESLWESFRVKTLLEGRPSQEMWRLESILDWFLLSRLYDSDNSVPVFPFPSESLF